MKERQRWKAEEDAILRAYVKQYGPREWNLVSQRMSVPLDRDAKSCLERWKNYLKPGIKKGSLTEEEQQLVVRLQAKHGNKWKKIAAEVPGRTAKRLGKWWEVFQDKKQREIKENNRASSPIEPGKYDRILENFAEKLVKEREVPPLLMATPLLPPWLSNSNSSNSARPPSPSVSLTLASSRLPAATPWPQTERGADSRLGFGNSQHSLISGVPVVDSQVMSGLAEYCKELEEGQKAWMAHKNEAAWRLRRVELQMETEKACKKREKMDEIEMKMRALREEQQVALDRIEAGYKEQISGLRRDAEVKEQKLAEQWAAKHIKLSRFLEQMGCCQWPSPEMNGR